ncbi:MAG TPA: ABC transporter [Cytophagales bacterium]|jgi:ABC-2 type transport system ATP-binding protein|nr:ABC transporter [Cytophagales bacterium]
MPDRGLSIETKNLTKKFGEFTAVDRITFEVEKGEIFGFLGANGAGKSTAMRMLCGLLSPTSGSATVAGMDVYRQSEKIKQRIGYMSQKFSLYEDLTVRENLSFYGGIYGIEPKLLRKRRDAMIEELGLKEVQNELIKGLPLGWKQKLSFSTAVLHAPEIVFLDEPTGGVDPITRRQFWEMINQTAANGTTVFVTTHYMDEAEYCDRISMMVDGKIAAMGATSSLKEQFNSKNMDEVFLHLARPKERSENE